MYIKLFNIINNVEEPVSLPSWRNNTNTIRWIPIMGRGLWYVTTSWPVQ